MKSKNTNNKPFKPLHVQVAERLIEQLKAGTAPWQKPWRGDNVPAFELPYNAVTGKRYKGINTFSLLLSGRDDPRWMTFNQASAKGWKVSKGEKATLIQFVKTSDFVPKVDERGHPTLDEKGNPVKIRVTLDRPVISNAWVFNAAQVEGIPPIRKAETWKLGWNPIDRAENLARNSAADIIHKQGDRAFYSPFHDRVTMPLKEQFDAPDKYYATLLHELGHWTGHKDRLDRSIMNRFGTKAYAREELRAEIASMLIGQELRIGHDPGQHVAYVDSWIQLLRDTPFEIHAAAADAEKIFAYLMALERKREISAKAEELPEIRQLTRTGKGSGALSMGDQIAYNGTVYKISGLLKRGRIRVEDTGRGQTFALSQKDGLYGSLLEAKLNPEPNIGRVESAAHAPSLEDAARAAFRPRR